jgi:hypothetical protein
MATRVPTKSLAGSTVEWTPCSPFDNLLLERLRVS